MRLKSAISFTRQFQTIVLCQGLWFICFLIQVPKSASEELISEGRGFNGNFYPKPFEFRRHIPHLNFKNHFHDLHPSPQTHIKIQKSPPPQLKFRKNKKNHLKNEHNSDLKSSAQTLYDLRGFHIPLGGPEETQKYLQEQNERREAQNAEDDNKLRQKLKTNTQSPLLFPSFFQPHNIFGHNQHHQQINPYKIVDNNKKNEKIDFRPSQPDLGLKSTTETFKPFIPKNLLQNSDISNNDKNEEGVQQNPFIYIYDESEYDEGKKIKTNQPTAVLISSTPAPLQQNNILTISKEDAVQNRVKNNEKVEYEFFEPENENENNNENNSNFYEPNNNVPFTGFVDEPQPFLPQNYFSNENSPNVEINPGSERKPPQISKQAQNSIRINTYRAKPTIETLAQPIKNEYSKPIKNTYENNQPIRNENNIQNIDAQQGPFELVYNENEKINPTLQPQNQLFEERPRPLYVNPFVRQPNFQNSQIFSTPAPVNLFQINANNNNNNNRFENENANSFDDGSRNNFNVENINNFENGNFNDFNNLNRNRFSNNNQNSLNSGTRNNFENQNQNQNNFDDENRNNFENNNNKENDQFLEVNNFSTLSPIDTKRRKNRPSTTNPPKLEEIEYENKIEIQDEISTTKPLPNRFSTTQKPKNSKFPFPPFRTRGSTISPISTTTEAPTTQKSRIIRPRIRPKNKNEPQSTTTVKTTTTTTTISPILDDYYDSIDENDDKKSNYDIQLTPTPNFEAQNNGILNYEELPSIKNYNTREREGGARFLGPHKNNYNEPQFFEPIRPHRINTLHAPPRGQFNNFSPEPQFFPNFNEFSVHNGIINLEEPPRARKQPPRNYNGKPLYFTGKMLEKEGGLYAGFDVLPQYHMYGTGTPILPLLQIPKVINKQRTNQNSGFSTNQNTGFLSNQRVPSLSNQNQGFSPPANQNRANNKNIRQNLQNEKRLTRVRGNTEEDKNNNFKVNEPIVLKQRGQLIENTNVPQTAVPIRVDRFRPGRIATTQAPKAEREEYIEKERQNLNPGPKTRLPGLGRRRRPKGNPTKRPIETKNEEDEIGIVEITTQPPPALQFSKPINFVPSTQITPPSTPKPNPLKTTLKRRPQRVRPVASSTSAPETTSVKIFKPPRKLRPRNNRPTEAPSKFSSRYRDESISAISTPQPTISSFAQNQFSSQSPSAPFISKPRPIKKPEPQYEENTNNFQAEGANPQVYEEKNPDDEINEPKTSQRQFVPKPRIKPDSQNFENADNGNDQNVNTGVQDDKNSNIQSNSQKTNQRNFGPKPRPVKKPEKENEANSDLPSSIFLKPKDVIGNRKPARRIPAGSASERLKALQERRKKLFGNRGRDEVKNNNDDEEEAESSIVETKQVTQNKREIVNRFKNRKKFGKNNLEDEKIKNSSLEVTSEETLSLLAVPKPTSFNLPPQGLIWEKIGESVHKSENLEINNVTINITKGPFVKISTNESKERPDLKIGSSLSSRISHLNSKENYENKNKKLTESIEVPILDLSSKESQTNSPFNIFKMSTQDPTLPIFSLFPIITPSVKKTKN